uniref:EF-hand domain-containing protein n=1 Tax=Mola mola TaxID=94237 RepID=A0A3Q3W8W2_MOLML
MDDGQEQDQYEERLKEVFNSFDTSGSGSLCLEELSELCQSLHLDDATPALLQTLLQNQDRHTARVNFDQFKNALILVLSSAIEPQHVEEETLSKPGKFVKGSKRYGRRSTPEFTETISDFSEVRNANPVDQQQEEEEEEEEDREDNYDSTSTEEFEAEGQMHLWNPDEPSTPRRSSVPLSSCLEERLREACGELLMTWDGCADHTELLALCKHLGLEYQNQNSKMLKILNGDGVMNVEEFISRVLNHNKPPTPSASTPYRQLKRHRSTQPFDEGGRRIAAPSVLTSTIGMRLFSTLDDGTGFTPVECILDAWLDEGIENSTEILQALNFNLDGKLSLSDLTTALENELLVAKNGIHQAAVASFKAEIRYLLERVDREVREKEKIQSDLEKTEKLKNQLATEVDEHHSAIEHKNNLNLRKLEQDHKEKLAAMRSELMQEVDQLQQQASLQREELEAEVQKVREDESFLRDHLSISVKENRRLEMELLDSTEKLVEAKNQIAKLQTCVDNIMKERFGDLDPGSADFLLQEERIKQLRIGYEAQYRELQDRIDELQAELREFHSLGRVLQPCNKPLSEELESKSPGMESDPGIGAEEVQPFSMSLEAEMMLEQLKEQHLQEVEDLRNQLESKVSLDQKATLALQYQQEVHALREEMAGVQSHAQELQSQLEQAELECTRLDQTQAKEREELENLQEEEVAVLRQQLLEAHTYTADLEEQLSTLEAQLAERDETLATQMEELREQHGADIKKLEEERDVLTEARLEEERRKLQEEKAELEKRLLDERKREKEVLQESHEKDLKAKLEEEKVRFEGERDEIVQRLTEQWKEERAQLDEENNESLQVLLEEEMFKLIREQEEKESKLSKQWEKELAELKQHQEEALLQRILQERLHLQEQFEQREKKLKEEWEMERLHLEENYEGMLQERLNEERARCQTETEGEENRLELLIAEERARLEESHREAVKDLTAKHTEERGALSSMLDKLRDDFAQESRTSMMCSRRGIPSNTMLQCSTNSCTMSMIKAQLCVCALHSTGLTSQNKRQYRDGVSRLMEKDQQLLQQEKERLQAEVCSVKEDLVQSREKVRQLDATILSLKQHKQQSKSSTVKALEQENASLKQELEAQKELNKVDTLFIHVFIFKSFVLSLEMLQHHLMLKISNKANLACSNVVCLLIYLFCFLSLLSLQQLKWKKLFLYICSSFVYRSLSSHQDERERKMKNMEERMREIEMSLHKVKLLLREKVAQLKEQLHKNGKADVLINDLYVENGQLLKALEITEQRQKIAEKKNYLLEEKISSLNKIVRDLNPSTLSSLRYHYKCS